MNVNRSQKHGPILHYITQAKSRTTKITVMHHTLTHFNSKSVNNDVITKNNGKMRTSVKLVKLYIIRNVLTRAIQKNASFIKFE